MVPSLFHAQNSKNRPEQAHIEIDSDPGGVVNELLRRKTRATQTTPNITFSTEDQPTALDAKKHMLLSDNEIRKATKNKELTINPPGHINPAGIDLRINQDLTLQPHQQTLAATLERVELSSTLAGILHIRSSLAREGLIASLALVDPGFRGQLTVSLYNAGARPVKLKQKERFIQLSLLRLTAPANKSYSGKYQNSRGIVASKRGRKILLA